MADFQFNIIKNDPLDGHKGTNIGAISLDNVAPVFIDIKEQHAFIDIGAMHARSEVEKRVKWVSDKSETEGPDEQEYWLVWVTTERGERGPYYAGVTACYMAVNKVRKRGYKVMAEHVNMMDKSMKHHYILEHIDADSRRVLKEFLMQHDAHMWELSDDALKTMLAE